MLRPLLPRQRWWRVDTTLLSKLSAAFSGLSSPLTVIVSKKSPTSNTTSSDRTLRRRDYVVVLRSLAETSFFERHGVFPREQRGQEILPEGIGLAFDRCVPLATEVAETWAAWMTGSACIEHPTG